MDLGDISNDSKYIRAYKLLELHERSSEEMFIHTREAAGKALILPLPNLWPGSPQNLYQTDFHCWKWTCLGSHRKRLFSHPFLILFSWGNCLPRQNTIKKKIKSKLPTWQKSGKEPEARSHGKCWVSPALSKHSHCCTSLSQPGCPGTPWFSVPCLAAPCQPFPWLIPRVQQAADITFS